MTSNSTSNSTSKAQYLGVQLVPSFRSLALSTPNVMDTFNDIQIWIYQMIFKTRGRGGTGSPMQGSVLIQCIVDHS